MVKQKTIQIVKTTVPILVKQGEELTKYFYKRMFFYNPEVKPLFNMSNQNGTQQRALAAAITAYADNIDNLEELDNVINLIVQKHVSLQIKSEHYPIVGKNLLAAIHQVLGELATEEVINAWAEAYAFLADLMIQREKKIYEDNTQKLGGWKGFRKFRVLYKHKESSNISSFYLVPVDNNPLPSFKPGQYITLRLPTLDGSTTMRNYSLSDKPGTNWLRISVKRETAPTSDIPEGYVSNYLHRNIEVDSELEIAPPCGNFFLNMNAKHRRALVFLAGGIGITPIMSMLLVALEARLNRKIILIHSILNEEVQAFQNTLEKLNQEHGNLEVHYRYSEKTRNEIGRSGRSSTGFISTNLIEFLVPNKDADYYFCGPKQFMVYIYNQLLEWNIPFAQIHFEFFGPKEELQLKQVV